MLVIRKTAKKAAVSVVVLLASLGLGSLPASAHGSWYTAFSFYYCAGGYQYVSTVFVSGVDGHEYVANAGPLYYGCYQ